MTAPPHGLLRDDDRALALVQQFGRTSTAFQALSPGLNHWFAETPGLVAYADTARRGWRRANPSPRPSTPSRWHAALWTRRDALVGV